MTTIPCGQAVTKNVRQFMVLCFLSLRLSQDKFGEENKVAGCIFISVCDSSKNTGSRNCNFCAYALRDILNSLNTQRMDFFKRREFDIRRSTNIVHRERTKL